MSGFSVWPHGGGVLRQAWHRQGTHLTQCQLLEGEERKDS